jgi:hypothetical protein
MRDHPGRKRDERSVSDAEAGELRPGEAAPAAEPAARAEWSGLNDLAELLFRRTLSWCPARVRFSRA